MDQLRSRTSMIGLFGDNSQINEMDHIDEYSFNLFDDLMMIDSGINANLNHGNDNEQLLLNYLDSDTEMEEDFEIVNLNPNVDYETSSQSASFRSRTSSLDSLSHFIEDQELLNEGYFTDDSVSSVTSISEIFGEESGEEMSESEDDTVYEESEIVVASEEADKEFSFQEYYEELQENSFTLDKVSECNFETEIIAQSPVIFDEIEVPIVEQESNCSTAVEDRNVIVKTINTELLSNNSSNSNASNDSTKDVKVKKKLNLTEYKLRRGNNICTESSLPPNELKCNFQIQLSDDLPTSLPEITLPTDPRPGALKTNNGQIKTEEKTKSILVPTLHPDYEEIIILSIGCNTDISRPPFENDDDDIDAINVDKSLKNIVNNLKKDNMQNILQSQTSLLSSIQTVVTQAKCNSTLATAAVSSDKNEKKTKEHGEDKVIMHLRKDRVRTQKCNFSVQTDNLSEFPPLLLLAPSNSSRNKSSSRNYRSRRATRSKSRSYSRSRSRSCNSSSYRYRSELCSKSRQRSRSNVKRSRNNSYTQRCNKSLSSSMNSSDSESDGSRSSSSSSNVSQMNSDVDHKQYRSRSRSGHCYAYYKRESRSRSRQNRNFKNPMPEERRIVYVGRIEENTTKEELKSKFVSYGPINKVSFHFKDTGLKYGFITFEKAENAYSAIDSSSKDPSINHYDVSFGGRREFCRQTYADLDNTASKYAGSSTAATPAASSSAMSFEDLLELAKKKLIAKKQSS
ncbi:unnamed protein product [Diamesa serratosioi]